MIREAFGAPVLSAGIDGGEWLAFVGTIAVVASGILAAKMTSGAAKSAAEMSAKARGQETYYDRLERDQRETRNRLDAIEAWRDAAIEQSQEHAAWDYLMADRIRERGEDVPEPPPILPPRRAYRPDEE